MNKTLTIVIPAYNESKRILKNLIEIDSYISKKSLKNLVKTIIVNDGSTDDTEEVVNNWISEKSQSEFSLIGYTKNRGKGYAIKEGFLNSKSDFILYTDADGASPIEEVEKLLDAISEGYDVACGSRVMENESSSVKMAIKRRFIGLMFHIILGFLSLNFIKDTQCGFKLFKSDVAKKLAFNQKCFNFSFDIEYLFLAKKLGYKIKEVPINWYHVKGSKVNLLVDSIKMLIEVLKIRFIYEYNV